MKIKIKNIASAGLPPEGIYKLEIFQASCVSGEGDKGPYDAVDVSFRIVEDAEGNVIPHKPFVNDRFFVSSESGLDRFIGLYSAALGFVPDEGEIDDELGEPVVNTEDLARDLVGQFVYSPVIWDTQFLKNGRYGTKVGWRFASEASKVRMPKKRDTDES